MVETVAQLTDHVFPRLPVRQWVLAVPKRLRYFMQRDGAVLNMVLRIFLRVIVQSLQSNRPWAAQVDRAALHIGALAFIHRFGSSLNGHVHFHVCALDGVFEEVAGDHWTTRNRPLVAVGLPPLRSRSQPRLFQAGENPKLSPNDEVRSTNCGFSPLALPTLGNITFIQHLPYHPVHLCHTLSISQRILREKTRLYGPTSTLATVHPAAAIWHLMVLAGLTRCATVRSTGGLHGDIAHFVPPTPGFT
jgi:hypothetical protein